MEITQFANVNALARDVSRRHRDRGCGKEGPTLVVLNTVKRAVDVWMALRRDKALKDASTDVRLVHSRFRPAERRAWREEFLNREACAPETNRIIVSTQVVEAGVDISASAPDHRARTVAESGAAVRPLRAMGRRGPGRRCGLEARQ